MKRRLQVVAFCVLVAAALYALGQIYLFSQTRFFTMDEYQTGHATWLVARGGIPYIDFYEHHFPLSYVMNAPFFLVRWEFATGALLLRKIVFGYWVLLALLAGGCCFAVTRNPLAGVLAVFLPLCLGFGLMSAVDYRPDNFGAIYFCACLLLLDWNRRKQSRGVAALAGGLATLAAGMTQTTTFVAGVALAGMLLCDVVARAPAVARRLRAPRLPFVARPGAFVASAGAVGLVLLAVAGGFGMLRTGFEITILQAFEHEVYYQPFSLFGKGYVAPFWHQTWPSTLAAMVFAVGFLVSRAGRLWILPILVTLVGGALIVAPYPYHFVLLCWIGAFAAVRGFAAFVEALGRRWPTLADATPLLYLLPLAALAGQLGFVSGTETNEHQLRVLRKIERYGKPGDAVIDDAGGAMFSPGASYYWYHGNAHRRMFRDYFENHLVEDYRKSQALFWIWDMRIHDLPKQALAYLHAHYIHGGDGLYVLGMRTPQTGNEPRTVVFDVVRPGLYYFHSYFHRAGAGTGGGRLRAGDLVVDGKALRRPRVRLGIGPHEIRIAPHSGEYAITPVPASFFDPKGGPPRYSMMFEYREPAPPDPRTTFISLADELASAENTSRGLDTPRALARLGPDDTILQRPGSVLRFTLRLPADPRLRGKFTLVGPLDPGFVARTKVAIRVESDGRETTLTERPPSELMKNPGVEFDANLEDYAGRTIELSLSFGRPEPAGAPRGRMLVWSSLRVDGMPPGEAAAAQDTHAED